jgi:tetratricopeptide (TPR) repeat protein
MLAVAIALLTTVAPPQALADGSRDPRAAETLFRSGREAFKRGDFAAACEHFADSQRLDPAPGTALNLAECEERLGHIASASRHLREAIALLPANDDRLPGARKRLPELERRVPRLIVKLIGTSQDAATVIFDGVELEASAVGARQHVDPGDHVVSVRVPGRAESTYRLTIREGEERSIDVHAGEPEGEASRATHTAARDQTRTLGWIALGFGGASIMASLITGAMVIDRGKERDALCRPGCAGGSSERERALDLNAEGKTLSAVSTVAFSIGVVSAVAGAYLVLSNRPSRGPKTALVPSVSARDATIFVKRDF